MKIYREVADLHEQYRKIRADAFRPALATNNTSHHHNKNRNNHRGNFRGNSNNRRGKSNNTTDLTIGIIKTTTITIIIEGITTRIRIIILVIIKPELEIMTTTLHI